MADGDIRVCPQCREIWVESSSTYIQPHRCPACGCDPEPDPAAPVEEITPDPEI